MFFQDEARFPFLRRRDLWGVLNLITKIRAFFCNCQQTFIPKKLSHFHILMFLSCEKLVSSNFPQQKIRRYIYLYIYILCILYIISFFKADIIYGKKTCAPVWLHKWLVSFARSITSPAGSHLGYQPPDMKVDHGGHAESRWLCASLP